MNFNEKIYPYKGTETVSLYQSYDEIKSMLVGGKVSFREEIWTADDETVPNPWNVLIIDNVVSFFFAKNKKLFKIVFWEGYKGTLPNGVSAGIALETAQSLDSTLSYNDWEEDYQSDLGYWLEDDPETGKVISLTVYIKEILEDSFDKCEW